MQSASVSPPGWSSPPWQPGLASPWVLPQISGEDQQSHSARVIPASWCSGGLCRAPCPIASPCTRVLSCAPRAVPRPLRSPCSPPPFYPTTPQACAPQQKDWSLKTRSGDTPTASSPPQHPLSSAPLLACPSQAMCCAGTPDPCGMAPHLHPPLLGGRPGYQGHLDSQGILILGAQLRSCSPASQIPRDLPNLPPFPQWGYPHPGHWMSPQSGNPNPRHPLPRA